LSEVVSACIQLLDKPTTELDEIMEIMPAPDYPTSADIVSSKANPTKTGVNSCALEGLTILSKKKVTTLKN
jgi:DNA gyrase/topoisomerase IV subunit A